MKNAIVSAFSLIVALSFPGFAAAQVPDCNEIYAKFSSNWKSTEVDKLRVAVTSGNEYLAKCSDQADNESQKDFIKKKLPGMTLDLTTKDAENAFAKAVKGGNWDESVTRGKQLLELKHPSSLDVMIILASIGYINEASNPPVNKYNDEAISFAKTVLQKIKEGSTSDNYGAFQFTYKTNKCPDGKQNVVSWMNYIIGHIAYDHGNKLADGVPYFYKALESACDFRDDAEILRLLGNYYSADAIKLIAARKQKIKDAGDVETDQAQADAAMINGYLDRAIIAYAHAYRSEKNAVKPNTESMQALYKRLQNFIESRYNQPDTEKVIAEAFTRPIPDPSTPVIPVKDPEPAPPPPLKKPETMPKKP